MRSLTADPESLIAHRRKEGVLQLLYPLLIQHPLGCYLSKGSMELTHHFGVGAPATSPNGWERLAPDRMVFNVLKCAQQQSCSSTTDWFV